MKQSVRKTPAGVDESELEALRNQFARTDFNYPFSDDPNARNAGQEQTEAASAAFIAFASRSPSHAAVASEAWDDATDLIRPPTGYMSRAEREATFWPRSEEQQALYDARIQQTFAALYLIEQARALDILPKGLEFRSSDRFPDLVVRDFASREQAHLSEFFRDGLELLKDVPSSGTEQMDNDYARAADSVGHGRHSAMEAMRQFIRPHPELCRVRKMEAVMQVTAIMDRERQPDRRELTPGAARIEAVLAKREAERSIYDATRPIMHRGYVDPGKKWEEFEREKLPQIMRRLDSRLNLTGPIGQPYRKAVEVCIAQYQEKAAEFAKNSGATSEVGRSHLREHRAGPAPSL